jgi:hypothetical protein
MPNLEGFPTNNLDQSSKAAEQFQQTASIAEVAPREITIVHDNGVAKTLKEGGPLPICIPEGTTWDVVMDIAEMIQVGRDSEAEKTPIPKPEAPKADVKEAVKESKRPQEAKKVNVAKVVESTVAQKPIQIQKIQAKPIEIAKPIVEIRPQDTVRAVAETVEINQTPEKLEATRILQEAVSRVAQQVLELSTPEFNQPESSPVAAEVAQIVIEQPTIRKPEGVALPVAEIIIQPTAEVLSLSPILVAVERSVVEAIDPVDQTDPDPISVPSVVESSVSPAVEAIYTKLPEYDIEQQMFDPELIELSSELPFDEVVFYEELELEPCLETHQLDLAYQFHEFEVCEMEANPSVGEELVLPAVILPFAMQDLLISELSDAPQAEIDDSEVLTEPRLAQAVFEFLPTEVEAEYVAALEILPPIYAAKFEELPKVMAENIDRLQELLVENITEDAEEITAISYALEVAYDKFFTILRKTIEPAERAEFINSIMSEEYADLSMREALPDDRAQDNSMPGLLMQTINLARYAVQRVVLQQAA